MLFDMPSLAGYSLMMTPSTSIPCSAINMNVFLMLDMFCNAKLRKKTFNGKYTCTKNQKREKIISKSACS